MLGTMGVTDRGMGGMQIYCRFGIGLQDVLKYIPVIFLGKTPTNYRISLGAYFVPCIKFEVLNPLGFKLGVPEHPQPPGSYVPACGETFFRELKLKAVSF